MTHLPPSSETPRVSYGILARLFIRLSLTTLGGPAAHIAIAEEEIVTRRRWLTREHYLDLIAATNLIPGPNSTEVMIHIGYLLRGFPGAVLAGACFIVPSSLLSLALAVLYVGGGSLPQIASVLAGIKPVIVAIIAGVGCRLLRTALRKTGLWVLFGLSVLVIVFSDVPEVLVMLGAGLLYALVQTGGTRRLLAGASGMALAVLPPLAAAPAAGIWDIFWYFLKIGSVLFGSGYVLIVYIQQDLVNNFGWLTGQQLLDSIAIGQMTPGPLSTTVTVVGYIVAGVPGAIIGTFGFFLPSFVLVILTAPLIPRMRRSPFLSAFLSGINAGVIAAILITLVGLANTALRAPDGTWSPAAIVLALAALVLLRFRVSATGLILLGGLIGLAAQFVGV